MKCPECRMEMESEEREYWWIDEVFLCKNPSCIIARIMVNYESGGVYKFLNEEGLKKVKR